MSLFAQRANWQNLDLKADSVFGISTERAYNELLKNKAPVKVIVAVIDAGADTSHEDLRAILWHNPKEKVNRKDDDHNGYVDDIYGWSFIGSANGNVKYDNAEVTRQVRQGMKLFYKKDTSAFSDAQMANYHVWKTEKTEMDRSLQNARTIVNNVRFFKLVLDTMLQRMGTQQPGVQQLANYQAENDMQLHIKSELLEILKGDPNLDNFMKNRVAKDLERAQ